MQTNKEKIGQTVLQIKNIQNYGKSIWYFCKSDYENYLKINYF